ncbi:uncharacterized protein RBU33_011852 isoform 2-T2 [Hipposideros larvatus]
MKPTECRQNCGRTFWKRESKEAIRNAANIHIHEVQGNGMSVVEMVQTKFRQGIAGSIPPFFMGQKIAEQWDHLRNPGQATGTGGASVSTNSTVTGRNNQVRKSHMTGK